VKKERAELKDDWQQFAEDIAACLCQVVCTLAPGREAPNDVRKQVLEAGARILRGLLGVVEGRLKRVSPPEATQVEKIRIQ
jgi:hypothetical protein